MFGTGLLHHLPFAWQPKVHRLMRPIAAYWLRTRLRGLARPASTGRHLNGRRVAILGLFCRRVGIGQNAELLAKELEAEGALVTKIDVTNALHLHPNRTCDDVTGIGVLTAVRFDLIIVHLNPPEFSHVRLKLPHTAIDRSTLIGYFAWELDRVPASWHESVASCNQVWVPSAFVAQSIERSFPEAQTKVRVREPRVELDKLPTRTAVARCAARNRLGLRDDTFVVLTSFSVRSTVARKNPLAAIQAFRQSIGSLETQAELLVRCLDADAFPDALSPLERAAAGDPRIHLVRIGQEASEIEDAYLAADMYISLHRSEGFGLNLAEASALGLPVLATGWGLSDSITGHPNFICVPWTLVPVIDPQHIYDQVPGALWAEADVEFAAAELRKHISSGLGKTRRAGDGLTTVGAPSSRSHLDLRPSWLASAHRDGWSAATTGAI
jgi:glycosyltransferase involved in cell wall biosynthesis